MKKFWWKESVVYQIYPRSFYDSNGDGIGDLRGIIQKLDYLSELGIDVVWLSPVYKSPNDDNGYDISDYQNIMDEFGTLADWEELISEMHQRGIKLVMDLVVNHSSDEHSWFLESRQSKKNPYRDYYIWRPGKNGHEPNNWASFFSGSVWQYDPKSEEYYLHLFSTKQPDLNWENPKVRQEVFDMMTWWLKKGVDGFRMDVINLISKVYLSNGDLPDGEIVNHERYQSGWKYYAHGPRFLEFLGEMRDQVLSNYDVLTVGETPGATTEQAAAITNEQSGALSMVFQFEHMGLDSQPGKSKWDLKSLDLLELKHCMTRWQKDLDGRGWNSLYLSNHDQPRTVSRFGDDTKYRVESAKMLGTFLHFQQGTPYIYQGEEIGMTNVRFPSISEYKDIETLNWYREEVNERGRDPHDAMQSIHAKGRDNARTPLQWNRSANAGFTDGIPWLKVNPNYPEINVEQSLADPNSIFHYYKKLIKLRRQLPVMVYGKYNLILPDHPQIVAYTRSFDTDQLLVICNFSRYEPVFELPSGIRFESKHLVIANYPVLESDSLLRFRLKPYEARVYALK